MQSSHQQVADRKSLECPGYVGDKGFLLGSVIRIAGHVVSVVHEDVAAPLIVRWILPEPVRRFRVHLRAHIRQPDRAWRCIRPAARILAVNALPAVEAFAEIAEYSESYGTQDDIRGTPTFVINGTQLDGGSWESVEAALQRAGAR